MADGEEAIGVSSAMVPATRAPVMANLGLTPIPLAMEASMAIRRSK